MIFEDRLGIDSIRGISIEKGERTKIILSKEAYERIQNMDHYNNGAMSELVDIFKQLDIWFLNMGIKL